MVDCHRCCKDIVGEPHEGVHGAFLCDDCFQNYTKCDGCGRAAPPHFLENGKCSHCLGI